MAHFTITKVDQVIIEVTDNQTTHGSSRVQGNLESAFPNSPQLQGYTDQVVKELWSGYFNKGVAINSPYFAQDVYMNYDDGQKNDDLKPPRMSSVLVGGEGLPSSPYTPNVAASPGVKPSNQPTFNGVIRQPGEYVSFGSGEDPSLRHLGKMGSSIGKTDKTGKNLGPGHSPTTLTISQS